MSLLSSITTLTPLHNQNDIAMAMLAAGFRLAPIVRGKYRRLMVAGEPWRLMRHRARGKLAEMGYQVSLTNLDQTIKELELFR